LLLFDLDHFKGVNDVFGHAAGDIVLSQTARVVQQSLRVSDSLVRWGGEEFIVLAPATRLDGAMSLAEKIRGAVASHAFPITRPVTVSIGVAEFLPGMDLDGWVRCADEALYRAKAAGRNRVMAGEGQSGAEDVPSILEIVWDEAYGCGEPTIDAQHQRLFALANALFGATTSGQPSTEISLRLRKLSAHAAQHFQDEEILLQKVGYADFSQHAQCHVELLAQMRHLQQEAEQGSLELARLVDFFIMEVVQRHLLAEDRKFFSCFQGGDPS
jgi:hemerythrin